MRFDVQLTHHATADLAEIVAFIRERDGEVRAGGVLTQFEQLVRELSRFPSKGVVPRELAELGTHDFRQVRLKPWRVVYRTQERVVVVMLIVDGRRNLQTLLTRRLLGPGP
jgi:toxin ParE1/3/4